jgi:hypothetical protein
VVRFLLTLPSLSHGPADTEGVCAGLSPSACLKVLEELAARVPNPKS